MTPNERRAELVRRGITIKSIAEKIEVARPSVCQVIANKIHTRKIQEAVATAIERPVEQVFPSPPIKGAA